MRRLAAALAVAFLATCAAAQSHVDRLAAAMNIDGLARVISDEGHTLWARFDRERMDGAGGAVWAEQVAQLYDPARLATRLRAGLADVNPETAETALIFLESDLGQRVVRLDLEARAALQNSKVLDAAQTRVLREGVDPQIDRIIEAGGLLDRNVVLGLNWQMRFQQGLARGGALDATDAEIATRVLRGEEAMRESLRMQLLALLALSLSPLDPDELDAYARYNETQAADAVNAALFSSVEALYNELAFAMGQAAALFLPRDDI